MAQDYRQPVYKAPADAADLYLIRHGETDPARAGEDFPTKDGHGDPGLFGRGPAQAEAVAARLGEVDLGAIYVTKLRRTHQTAAPLAARTGLTPVEDPDLHEVFLGEWDLGLYRIKAAERDPVYMDMLLREDWGVIPGAEPRPRFLARIERGISRIAAAHVGEKVALVLHGGVIAGLLHIATGSRPFAFQGPANGSISRLVIRGERWILRGFNDTSHLDEG